MVEWSVWFVSWERYLALDKDRARVHAFATGVGGPWKSSS